MFFYNVRSSVLLTEEQLFWRGHPVYLWFLAGLSSSRSLVAGPSVRLSVRPSVRWSVSDVIKKMTFRVSKGNNTYLCTYLQDSSDSIDSIDSSDSSDSNDSCDSSDSNDSSDSSDQTTLYTKKIKPIQTLPTYLPMWQ